MSEENINQVDSNGLRQGLWRNWYSINGNLMHEGCYVNDRMSGVWKYWDTKGRLWVIVFLKHGIEGERITFNY